MNYERHFLSACWPDISGEEFEHLKDSIGVSGLRDAITLYEGQILDGWNRYRACNETGIKSHFVEFDGDDADQFVRDKHNRRSMTLTQRMTCISKMATWAPVGRPNNSAGPALFTAPTLAKQTGGSIRTAKNVKAAIAGGSDELVSAMTTGKVGAEKAAWIATLPKEQQAAAINKPLPKPALAVVKQEEPEEPAPDYTELDSALDTIAGLQAELAVVNMGQVDPSDKNQATELIAELRRENAVLRESLKAVTRSRDTAMNELAEAKRMCVGYQKQLKLVKKA